MKLIQFNVPCVGIIEKENDEELLAKRKIAGQHPCYILIDAEEIFEIDSEKSACGGWETPCVFLIDGVRVQGWNTHWTEKTKDWYMLG